MLRPVTGSINGGAAAVNSRTRLYQDNDNERGAYASISDSEGPLYTLGGSAPARGGGMGMVDWRNLDRLYSDNEQTDDEDGHRMDEFDNANPSRDKTLRTGRQRKKLAARTKGGEFQARRKKRRVYFCCVSSDIDVQKLFDYLVTTDTMAGIDSSGSGGGASAGAHHNRNWRYELYPGGDVLHLFRPGYELLDPTTGQMGGASELQNSYSKESPRPGVGLRENAAPAATTSNARSGVERRGSIESNDGDFAVGEGLDGLMLSGTDAAAGSGAPARKHNPFRISTVGAQEVFIFDFGAAVFWGYSKGEELALLKTVRMFVTKGLVEQHEFSSGEDDMAFVTTPELTAGHWTLTNDFITLPDDSSVKDRLSISFAVGQSSVLAIFEARIERKIEEYKYIPEALAACGKVHLSEQQLGIMIGEVFVIRHDVNLHTEILDTPTFFWKEHSMEQDYKMVMDYLEMPGRTEILNKRLDMMRELLDVLQQQMESNHALNLEWIVIYLIVVEVVLQAVPIIISVLQP